MRKTFTVILTLLFSFATSSAWSEIDGEWPEIDGEGYPMVTSTNQPSTMRVQDIQVTNVVEENTACPENGRQARNANGAPLFCQSGVWQPVQQTPPGTICGMVSNGGSAGNWCQGFNPSTGCPPGYQQQAFRVNFGDSFMYWCSKL